MKCGCVVFICHWPINWCQSWVCLPLCLLVEHCYEGKLQGAVFKGLLTLMHTWHCVFNKSQTPCNACICVSLYRCSLSLLGSSLFKHLQIHAERLLNGVFGDEADKVLDVGLSVGRQLVDGWLPHHGLGDLSGVVCKERTDVQLAHWFQLKLSLFFCPYIHVGQCFIGCINR